jgi:hypothetical protein
MKVKRFKAAQKFRVIVGSASFYATASQIRKGVGDFTQCNSAVIRALNELELTRSSDDLMSCATGLACTYEGLQVQLNVA